ncbi:hypothetical protein, partial [Halospina sp. K52047b]|uniref:hypothetical protein n=1 Tax=Halospina sp. K52047b TaxID=2614160 RepID=UPI001CE47AD6
EAIDLQLDKLGDPETARDAENQLQGIRTVLAVLHPEHQKTTAGIAETIALAAGYEPDPFDYSLTALGEPVWSEDDEFDWGD